MGTFPVKGVIRVLLRYCDSDREQKQLQLLQSFSPLQALSDDLAVNVRVRSVELYKDKMQIASDSNSDNRAADRARLQNDAEGQ